MGWMWSRVGREVATRGAAQANRAAASKCSKAAAAATEMSFKRVASPSLELAAASTGAARRRLPGLFRKGMQARAMETASKRSAATAASSSSGAATKTGGQSGIFGNLAYSTWIGVVGFPSLLIGSFAWARHLDKQESENSGLTCRKCHLSVPHVTVKARDTLGPLAKNALPTGLPSDRVQDSCNFVCAQEPESMSCKACCKSGLSRNRIEEVRV